MAVYSLGIQSRELIVCLLSQSLQRDVGCLSKLWGEEKTIDLCLDTCILRLTTKTNLLFGSSEHDCQFSFATDSSNKKIKCAVSFPVALHSYHTGTETPQWKTGLQCQGDPGCCCGLAVGGNTFCSQTSLCCFTCLWHYSLQFSLQLPDPSDWNQNTRQQQCLSSLSSQPMQ